jgi:predicted RNase H-like HicB family nuclease
MAMAKKAIELYIESLVAHNEPVIIEANSWIKNGCEVLI